MTATTSEQAIESLAAVARNFTDLSNQIEQPKDNLAPLIQCCDVGDQTAESIADRARLAGVDRSRAMRVGSAIGDHAATAAANLRKAQHYLDRAQEALGKAASASRGLVDVATEAQQRR